MKLYAFFNPQSPTREKLMNIMETTPADFFPTLLCLSMLWKTRGGGNAPERTLHNGNIFMHQYTKAYSLYVKTYFATNRILILIFISSFSP